MIKAIIGIILSIVSYILLWQDRNYITMDDIPIIIKTMLLEYKRKLDESRRVLEENRKLSHALMEYNYNKDRESVLFSDKIAWRDSLSPEEEASYREYLRKDLGSDKVDVVNKIK